MKKIAAYLLAGCLLFALALPLNVCATALDGAKPSAGLSITATVPSEHTVNITASHATVLCNNEIKSAFTVARLSEPGLLVLPDAGYRVTRVTVNGTDVTAQVRGGYYTLPPVFETVNVSVETEENPEITTTKYILTGIVTKDGKPSPNLKLELHSTPKTTVTDQNGAFRFENVEDGFHTLTAWRDDKVSGHLEFTLQDGNSVSVENGEGGVYTLTASDGTTGLQMALALSEDGRLSLTDVAAMPADSGDPADSASTGEHNLIPALTILSLVCVAMLIVTGLRYKRRCR